MKLVLINNVLTGKLRDNNSEFYICREGVYNIIMDINSNYIRTLIEEFDRLDRVAWYAMTS